MRRYIIPALALGCLAVSALGLSAQEVLVRGAAKGAETIPAPAGTACPAPCAPPCCVATYKACVAVPDLIKRTKVLHSAVCKDYCLPRWKPHLGHKSCDDSCPTGACAARARHKNVLLKKVVTEECPGTKCVVEERVREKCHHSRCKSCTPSCQQSCVTKDVHGAAVIPAALNPPAPPPVQAPVTVNPLP